MTRAARWCRRVIDAASPFVPGDMRDDWRREWLAEIAWYSARKDAPPHAGLALAWRAVGAIVHAGWLRWDRWRFEMWSYDLKIAARGLARQPAFLALAVLTLGLGIGATASIFSAVRAVMLRPLPFPAPDELVAIMTTEATGASIGASSSPSDVADWQGQQHTLVALSAFVADALAFSGRQAAEQVPGASVTGAFFDVLGVAAARGRTLTPADARAGAAPAVVLSDALWRRRYGADPGVVGTSVVVEGVARDVVGVMPPGVAYPLGAEAWVPLSFTEKELATQRGAQYLDVVGRLRPGTSLDSAQADLGAIAGRLAEQYPRTNEGRGVGVHNLQASIVGNVRPGLLLLLAAAVVVLLIVCANVAGLLLTRAMAASRDLAIRTALGAGRARLVRGALAESGLLAGAGCAIGIGIAWAAARRIAAIDGSLRVPLIEQTRVDTSVVAVAVAAAAVSVALFGVAPAWRASGLADLARRVRAGGMAMSARGRGRAVLAVAEIALAVVLVVGAISLARSFARLMAVDVGFETSDRVQTFGVALPEARYATPHDRRQFVDRLLTQVRALPGVERAGAVFGLPLTGFGYTISVSERDGAKVPDTAQDMLLLRVRVATPDYLQAIGLALRRGRAFLPGDGPSSPRVALVNEAAARMLWPGVDPLGRHVTVGTRLGQDDERVGGEIVGVVADTREGGPMSEPRPTIYVVQAQFPVGTLAVAVRRAPGGAGVPALRAVLAALDPDVPMYRVRTTEQLAAASVAQPRLLMLLMSLFGVAALVVAAIGLYGVLAQVVEARRQEIGIRRAVGAGVNHVVGLVARDTLGLLVSGVTAGVACAVALTAGLPRLAPSATAPDAGAYVAAIGVFSVVAVLAAAVPCYRALAVDPAVTLKGD